MLKRSDTVKINEMVKGQSIQKYFIVYYDNANNEWQMYNNKQGYSYFTDEYLIYHLTEVKKLSDTYRVYKQVTTRVE